MHTVRTPKCHGKQRRSMVVFAQQLEFDVSLHVHVHDLVCTCHDDIIFSIKTSANV